MPVGRAKRIAQDWPAPAALVQLARSASLSRLKQHDARMSQRTRSARHLGRWPVATMEWWNGVVDARIFSRLPYGKGDNSPQAICARARTLTVEDALTKPHLLDAERYYATEWDKVVTFALEDTRRRLGTAPSLEEVLALDLRPDHVALERWLLDWKRPGDQRGHRTPAGISSGSSRTQTTDARYCYCPRPQAKKFRPTSASTVPKALVGMNDWSRFYAVGASVTERRSWPPGNNAAAARNGAAKAAKRSVRTCR